MSRFEKSHSNQGRILIVDDHWDNLELLSAILTSQGYEVQAKDRGKLAIETAKANPPDIILLDISMPEMDGFEVCRQLQKDKNTKDIPIIFISALKKTSDKTKAFEHGGKDYITKPFDIEEVLARVKNQLEIHRRQIELKTKNTYLQQEISDRKSTEEQLLKVNQKLIQLATLDSLTQIANRHRFEEFLELEWRRAQREQVLLSLILCDIDYFKFYNDYFGHQAGDTCLKKVAQTIANVVKRPGDLVARYGGEEFVIILSQTPPENALQVAEIIRLRVKDLCLVHPSSLISDYVSLSLGVTSVIPSPLCTKQQLLYTADQALYQAKQQGRDRAILKLLSLE